MKNCIEITNQLYEFERKHDLFMKKTSDGIYYWTLIRQDLLFELWKKNDLLEITQGVPFHSSLIKRLPSIAWNIFINELNFIFRLKKRRVAFLCTSRNINEHKKAIDLMLNDYFNTFEGEYNIIETYNSTYFKNDPDKYKNRVFIYWLELKKKLFPYKNGKIKEDFHELSDLLNRELGLNRDWNGMIKQFLYNYKLHYKFYKNVFRRLKPECLIYTVLDHAAVAAANDMNIVTMEVLHGTPAPSTVAWHISDNEKIKSINSMPKLLFTFSTYWDRFITNHLVKVDVGNNFFYSPPPPDKKRTKTFTVISSIYTFKSVIELAYQTAVLLPDHFFYIKLQSAEIDHIKHTEKKFSGMKNISIVFNEYNVNQLFDRSDYVLLVQSSCTYQALQKGLDVFIYKRLYYHESEDVFKNPLVHLIDSAGDIAAKIQTIDKNAKPSDGVTGFFDPYNENKLKETLKNHLPDKSL